jgi:hypothetical protein
MTSGPMCIDQVDTSWKCGGGLFMATVESLKRMERRRRQRGREEWNRTPEVIALRREMDRCQRYKHGQDLPYTSGEFSGLVSKCLDN